MQDKVINFPIANKNTPKIAVVIPARIASTRFPDKMLEEVVPGVTLIEWVYEQVCKQHYKDDVYIATDSSIIMEMFGRKALLTHPKCENGTDRVAEAAKLWLPQYDYFINVQGDMIDLPTNAIKLISQKLMTGNEVVTLCTKMSEEERLNPNSVKCINNGEDAHWFGRGFTKYGDWHLGVYGYAREMLEQYPDFHKYPEEEIESLEQLRWIQNYVNVSITFTDERAFEINTPEDLKKWQSTRLN